MKFLTVWRAFNNNMITSTFLHIPQLVIPMSASSSSSKPEVPPPIALELSRFVSWAQVESSKPGTGAGAGVTATAKASDSLGYGGYFPLMLHIDSSFEKAVNVQLNALFRTRGKYRFELVQKLDIVSNKFTTQILWMRNPCYEEEDD